jgi:hypothetical protein
MSSSARGEPNIFPDMHDTKMWNKSSDPDKPVIGLFLIGCVQTITMTIC